MSILLSLFFCFLLLCQLLVMFKQCLQLDKRATVSLNTTIVTPLIEDVDVLSFTQKYKCKGPV